jgi:hypothetical protein
MANNIYTIGNKKYEFDEPLTPEELRQLEVKLGVKPSGKPPATAPTPESVATQPPPAAPSGPQKPAGTLEYLLNAAKRGVTGTTSMLGAAYETGSEMNRRLKEMEERSRRENMTVQQRMDMLRQSGYFPSLADLVEKYGEQQRQASRITGAKDLAAPGPVTEILGAGVEAATDPLGLIGKAKILPVAKRAVGEFVTGTSADIGGRGGAAVEEAITGEESGLGRLAGSVLAGGASTLKRETGSRVFNELLDKYRQVKLTGSSDEAAEEYAKGAAKRLLEFAAKEQGADSLQEIIKEAGEAAKFSTGENAPLLVALADNPVIRQQVIRLAKTDPAFRQQVNDTLASLGGDMRSKVEKIFGVRYQATGKEPSIFDPGYVPGKETPKGLDLAQLTADVAERRNALTQRIEDIASGFDPTKSKEEIGSRIESLIEDKKKLARQEVSPEYEKLLSEARSAGVEMPPEGVGTIYDFVRQNNLQDIFGKGTALDRRIMGVLAPKEFPVPGTAETVLEHLPMSFDNVESLKKAINDLKRQRMSEDSMRKVMLLEEVVDEARNTIPGDFSKRLNEVDLKYYEKVGVPFGAQGVKDVDSKKYATQVAPIIVKNSESFDQFIRAVGKDDGYKIAEDSIISEIYDKAIKDGELNPGALAKYIKQKEGIISQIPGLEDKLRTALSDDSALRTRINQLDDAAAAAQKRIADNALTKFEAPNYTTLARSFMTDPKSRTKLLRDIGDLDADSAKAVRRTLRAEVIALADENPAGFMDYLMNPANKDALDKIFGSAFQPALRKVGLLSDKLAQADISKVGVAVTKEDLDPLAKLAPGLDIPYISSTFRDRITSFPQKVVRLMSRVNSARLLQKTDETIKELLLDPNGVQKLANVASEIDFSVDVAGRLKKLSNTLSDVMPRALYTSGKTAVAGEERAQRAEERQEQLAEDIITGGFESESEGEVPVSPPQTETEVREEPAEGYTYENLGPDQIAKVGRYLDQYGLNKDFLLNAQTFNATPVEKRKKLFDLLASNRMAKGGVVEDKTDYTQYNSRILRALIKRYGSEQKARQVMRDTDAGELLKIMREEESASKYTPAEKLLLRRYANR